MNMLTWSSDLGGAFWNISVIFCCLQMSFFSSILLLSQSGWVTLGTGFDTCMMS